VVTLDADFHAILAVSGAKGPFVIRIRKQELDAVRVVEVVERVLGDYGADLMRGSLVTVKLNKITCHRLPIGGQ
jgi:predicted nuclease of predicted toxin-antitoxin system